MTVYSDVDAIAGRLVQLPCFVRPLEPSDSISLVLWFHGEDISGTPIYSVDARFNPFHKAQHFVHKQYQNRQVMNFTLSQFDKSSETVPELWQTPPPSGSSPRPNNAKPVSASTAHLLMMPVVEGFVLSIASQYSPYDSASCSDAGLYWCRVDYRFYRSTISIVTVNVIGELVAFAVAICRPVRPPTISAL